MIGDPLTVATVVFIVAFCVLIVKRDGEDF